MKLMDIISEIMRPEHQYKIEFISYSPEYDVLKNLNGHKVSELNYRSCINYYRNGMDMIMKKEYFKRKYHWYKEEYRPKFEDVDFSDLHPLEMIVRKVGDKYIASFHMTRIEGKLILTKMDSYTTQFHKRFDPKD